MTVRGVFLLSLFSVGALSSCVPEAGDALRLHDVAIFSNATDLRGLYGYFYGPPSELGVGGAMLTLSEDVPTGFAGGTVGVIGERGSLT